MIRTRVNTMDRSLEAYRAMVLEVCTSTGTGFDRQENPEDMPTDEKWAQWHAGYLKAMDDDQS